MKKIYSFIFLSFRCEIFYKTLRKVVEKPRFRRAPKLELWLNSPNQIFNYDALRPLRQCCKIQQRCSKRCSDILYFAGEQAASGKEKYRYRFPFANFIIVINTRIFISDCCINLKFCMILLQNRLFLCKYVN